MVRVPDTPSSFGDAASWDVTELGTTMEITVHGGLDATAVPALRDAARRVGLAPGRVLVLDLCGATLADAAVVELALGLRARATAQGASLVVVVRPRDRALFARAAAEGVTIVGDAGEQAS